jgi:hypothetical protein
MSSGAYSWLSFLPFKPFSQENETMFQLVRLFWTETSHFVFSLKPIFGHLHGGHLPQTRNYIPAITFFV